MASFLRQPKFLSFLFSLLAVVTSSSWCNYECLSNHPAQFGPLNLDSGFGALPFNLNRGYAPVDFKQVCSDPSTLWTPSLHPQPAAGRRGTRNSPNFIAICPAASERVIKFMKADVIGKELSTLFTVEIEGEDEIVGFNSNFGRVAVMTERTIKYYSALSPQEEDFQLLWEYVLDPTVLDGFSGMPIVSRNFVIGIAGSKIVKVPQEFEKNPNPASVELVETESENALGYNLLDADDNLFFCSDTSLMKVSNGGSVSAIDLQKSGLKCSGLILPQKGRLIFSAKETNSGTAQSVLAEVFTKEFESFTVFGNYKRGINAISRVGWDSSTKGLVAFIGASTDSGIMVVVDELVNYTRGDVVSDFDTAEALFSTPVLTSLAEPIAFSQGEVIAYSETRSVKFYSTDVTFKPGQFESLPQFGDISFSSSPVLVPIGVIGVATDGKILLYKHCVRYKFGEEPPENACPVADLTEAEGIPTWITIIAGAGAVLSVPICSEFICRKMKLIGPGDDDESEYSDDEYDEDYDESDSKKVDPGLILAPQRS